MQYCVYFEKIPSKEGIWDSKTGTCIEGRGVVYCLLLSYFDGRVTVKVNGCGSEIYSRRKVKDHERRNPS